MVRKVSRRNLRSKRVKSRGSRSLRKKRVKSRGYRSLRRRRSLRHRRSRIMGGRLDTAHKSAYECGLRRGNWLVNKGMGSCTRYRWIEGDPLIFIK